MKPKLDIEQMVKELRHAVDNRSHDRILTCLLSRQEKHHQSQPVAMRPTLGRIIMKNPML